MKWYLAQSLMGFPETRDLTPATWIRYDGCNRGQAIRIQQQGKLD
jgi:hypothetical protein